MLRAPAMARLLRPAALGPMSASPARHQGTQPDKVEVFVDGQSVLVDPGTTVLQVRSAIPLATDLTQNGIRRSLCLGVRVGSSNVIRPASVKFVTKSWTISVQTLFLTRITMRLLLEILNLL